MIIRNFCSLKIPVLVVAISCASHGAFCQPTQKAIEDTGAINGAKYKINIPANWNKNLVMYAHGYEQVGSAVRTWNMGETQQMEVYLSRGFAVARSAYRKKGWALTEGVEDNEALRKYFIKKYGSPDSTFITGHSMGGGVALATIENLSTYYTGTLAMCPLSSRPYIMFKSAFDGYAVFNFLFPGILPSLKTLMDPAAPVPSSSERQTMALDVIRRLQADTASAGQVARFAGLKVKDIPGTILFTAGILRDIAQQAGGNPFDNTNTLYSGFPDDMEVNQKVERLPTTPGTENFFNKYDRTGQINRPVVLLQTIYDQLIRSELAVVNYDNMVHQSAKQNNLVMFFTNGQAHCSFTQKQIGIAFDALRVWAATHKKPVPGIIN